MMDDDRTLRWRARQGEPSARLTLVIREYEAAVRALQLPGAEAGVPDARRIADRLRHTRPGGAEHAELRRLAGRVCRQLERFLREYPALMMWTPPWAASAPRHRASLDNGNTGGRC